MVGRVDNGSQAIGAESIAEADIREKYSLKFVVPVFNR